MRAYRRSLNAMDDQAAPLWFVFCFCGIAYLYGNYVVLTAHFTSPQYTPSPNSPVPPLQLIMWLALLCIVWAVLRIMAAPPMRLSGRIILFIPLVMSVGTAIYAYTIIQMSICQGNYYGDQAGVPYRDFQDATAIWYMVVQLVIYGIPFGMAIKTRDFIKWGQVHWLIFIVYTFFSNGIDPGLVASVLLGWLPAFAAAGLGCLIGQLNGSPLPERRQHKR